jgi:hypothetical protein
MSFLRASLALFLSLVLSASSWPQQVVSDLQALTLASKAYAGLTGSLVVTDATFTGTARRIAGSDDDTGTVTLKAIATGASRMDLSLSSGQWSEVQNISGSAPTGSWFGSDGVSHAIAQHNLLTEPAWFYPAFVLARGLSSSGYVTTYVGHETWNSTTVEHLAIYLQPSTSLGMTEIIQHLSRQDIYLDSSSLLPVAMTFNVHPDDNAGLDIPVQICFSDYRAVNGAQVPFHVQKYLNNGLVLDLQFQSVNLNAGISVSAF